MKGVVSKVQVYLFLDLDQVSYNNDQVTFDFLWSCARICDANVLLSISSGSHMYASTKLEPGWHTKLQGFLKQNWTSVYITGFTEAEAKCYISNEGFKYKFEQIMDISGTNPLLLSLLCKDDKLADYQAKVSMEEKEFF